LILDETMIDHNFFGFAKQVLVSELAAICNFRMVGGGDDFFIKNIASLKQATGDELSFFGNRKYQNAFKKTKAGAVVISEKDVSDLPDGVVGLVTVDVMVGLARAIDLLFTDELLPPHISHFASIHETVVIGPGCHIGDFTSLEDGVEIGNNATIGSNCVIKKKCKIGDGCRIGNNVTISHTIMKNNVVVNSGARIGEAGFGFIPTASSIVPVKQLGRVLIGNNVRIGANCTIDRGSMDDTTIADGTVIDNLVQIGHNVTIGEHAVIVAQVGIAGSSRIGNNVILAGQVGVAGHLEIGDGVVVASKSGVASSLEPGNMVGGIPAVDIDTWRRQVSFLKTAVTKKKITAEEKKSMVDKRKD
jgi:UDP-3-O-[3-hydroxymyristoyl] glucosamine N-acyltransferase